MREGNFGFWGRWDGGAFSKRRFHISKGGADMSGPSFKPLFPAILV